MARSILSLLLVVALLGAAFWTGCQTPSSQTRQRTDVYISVNSPGPGEVSVGGYLIIKLDLVGTNQPVTWQFSNLPYFWTNTPSMTNPQETTVTGVAPLGHSTIPFVLKVAAYASGQTCQTNVSIQPGVHTNDLLYPPRLPITIGLHDASTFTLNFGPYYQADGVQTAPQIDLYADGIDEGMSYVFMATNGVRTPSGKFSPIPSNPPITLFIPANQCWILTNSPLLIEFSGLNAGKIKLNRVVAKIR